MNMQDPVPRVPGTPSDTATRRTSSAPGGLGNVRLPAAGAGAVSRPSNGVAFSRQLAALRQPETVPTPDPGTPASAGPASSATPTPEPRTASASFPYQGQHTPAEVTVRRGDTLTSLVRARWATLGGSREALSAHDAHRWALQVARDNGLSDPDRIQVGQSLVLGSPVGAVASGMAKPAATAKPLPAPIVRVDAAGQAGSLLNPVLAQTLDRAVDLGYIPTADRSTVSERIAALADKHGFKPDDFAKAVLMESDGLNPKASNGRCHGIIQFCSGPDRGAASAGYGQRPQEILKLSVLQQLDLVDRYFDDTKLRDFRGRDGQVRLDDLYLTILTPAARQERSLTAALPIAGPQALDLHVKRERQSPITRSSILAGLNVNAKARLGQFMVADLMAR